MNKFIYTVLHIIYDVFRYTQYYTLYCFFRIIPLKKKIVASSFNGDKYGDNTKCIIEEIHKIDNSIELIWLCNPDYDYDVPEYVKRVKCSDKKNILLRLYHYYTAQIWMDTHLYDKYLKKRKGQFVIETWHGGLGIKKIEGDVNKFSDNSFQIKKILKTSSLADLFISNSDFLSNIYRRAFFYKGEIWKVGFPKNDVILSCENGYRKVLLDKLNVSNDTKIIIYAPTYRGKFEKNGKIDLDPYIVEFDEIIKSFNKRFGGNWIVLTRWHPWMKKEIINLSLQYPDNVYDATEIMDMPEIITCANAFISDYSSCIFDAALKRIPCFIYANDFQDYVGDRGVYYTLDQLPFPCATNIKELISNIDDYNTNYYISKITDFEENVGLFEKGNAGYLIAERIVNIINAI